MGNKVCACGKEQNEYEQYESDEGETKKSHGSSAASASKYVVPIDFDLAYRCPTALIHLIYSYLSISDRLHAALTCKHWLAAAERDRMSSVTLRLRHPHPLADVNRVTSLPCCSMPTLLARSSLRHWVTELHIQHTPLLSLQHLACATELPRLKSLSMLLDRTALYESMVDAKKQGRPCAVRFPHTLTELDLSLTWSPDAEVLCATYELVLDGLSPLHSLHSLHLSSPSGSSDTPGVAIIADVEWRSWIRLASLHSLQTLTLRGIRRDASLLHAIKQIRLLKRLELWTHQKAAQCWTTDQLNQLCQRPHQLNDLQTIGPMRDTQLSATDMEQLQHLPSLTSLHPLAIMPDALHFLPRFNHLSELSLHIRPRSAPEPHVHTNDETSPTYAQEAAQHLSNCPSLIFLTLILHVELDDERIPVLLDACSTLRKLRLQTSNPIRFAYRTGPIARLECLDGLVGRRLEWLELNSGMSPIAIPSIPPLPNLNTFIVRTVHDEVEEKQLHCWWMKEGQTHSKRVNPSTAHEYGNRHGNSDDYAGSSSDRRESESESEHRLMDIMGLGPHTTPKLHTVHVDIVTYTLMHGGKANGNGNGNGSSSSSSSNSSR